MNVTDWAEAWFKPEVVLPAAAKHTATGLFAVDWLPYMLTGELLISALMGKHVSSPGWLAGWLDGWLAGWLVGWVKRGDGSTRPDQVELPSPHHLPAASHLCHPAALQVYNLRQLICNLSMPFFFHLVAREWCRR